MSSPRICLIDIETSPITGYTWSTYDTNVLKILEPSKLLSVSWKYLNEEEVFCKTLIDYKGYKPGVIDDKKLAEEVWKIIDDADILIGHNGDAFDVKKLNGRFLFHGLSAPSPYQTVDTLKVSKKYFKLDSNSLNNIGAYLNLGQKVPHSGFALWTDCISGDSKAWELMKEYNKQDVILLEKVYLALRPFMDNHPDLSLITEESSGVVKGMICHTCLGSNTTKRGFSRTKTGKKQRWQCSDCASWSTGSFERTVKQANFSTVLEKELDD